MTHPPLPEPDMVLIVETPTRIHSVANIYAYADTVLAAARDCRTCRHSGMFFQRCVFIEPRCTDANRYEPLPPVRLWKESK